MRFSLLDVFAWTIVTTVAAAALALGAAVSSPGSEPSVRPATLASGNSGATSSVSRSAPAPRSGEPVVSVSLSTANDLAPTVRR